MPIVEDHEPNFYFCLVNVSIEVFQPLEAQVLDHLLKHIKVLTSVAQGSIWGGELDWLVSDGRYELDPENPDLNRLATLLKDECAQLLEYFLRIVSVKTEDEKRRIHRAMQARIPYLELPPP